MQKILKGKNLRLSIRSRFFIVLLLLTILPFLAYRFAIDLHQVLLKNQATIQNQTVVNLSLILENRTDLWAMQIQAGNPTSQLAHLNLTNSVLWIVNEYGQTTYVVGSLPKENSLKSDNIFGLLGATIIKTFATFLPFSLPYPYPQSTTPEKTLITKSIRGETFQQYRMNKNNQPISLMSSSPLRVKGRILGVIVLEQKMSTMLGESLRTFYHLVGMGALIFLFSILGAIVYIAALSRRIMMLDADVSNTFKLGGKITTQNFTDGYQRGYHDELSDLRHHIYEMLQQLSSYERYLKQFPKALRHELHNPLNRLSMSLSLLEADVNHKQLDFAQHAVAQLKQIIASLTEATSIEDSLLNQPPEAFPVISMLNHYMENVLSLNPQTEFIFKNQESDALMLMGDGFMLEQLMDKLISNAKDFNDGKTSIQVLISSSINHHLIIKVINSGQALPEGFENRIFDGMTSIRKVNEDTETHLGLGLYIVKLIAEYHQGKVTAHNLNEERDGLNGVLFKVSLPLMP